MKIKLIAPTAREIAATGAIVEPGGTVEVTKDLGEALCLQSDVWEPVTAPAKSTSSKKES